MRCQDQLGKGDLSFSVPVTDKVHGIDQNLTNVYHVGAAGSHILADL